MRSVQGDVAMVSDACLTTTGGIKLQSKYARVNPSSKANGSSFESCGVGTAGRCSTMACAAVYKAGTTPDTMNDGGTPNNGAVNRDAVQARWKHLR